MLHIWDTAGQEKFRSVVSSYYNDSEGCILVFDLTKQMTLKNIHKWVLELRKRVGKECILYLLGNKSDLIDDRNVTESDVNQVI